MHRFDPPLRCQPLLLAVVIDHLDFVPVQPGDDPGSQGNVKLTPGDWLDPDMFPLILYKV